MPVHWGSLIVGLILGFLVLPYVLQTFGVRNRGA